MKKIKEEQKKAKFNLNKIESKKNVNVSHIKKHFLGIREELEKRENYLLKEYDELYTIKSMLIDEQIAEYISIQQNLEVLQTSIKDLQTQLGKSTPLNKKMSNYFSRGKEMLQGGRKG